MVWDGENATHRAFEEEFGADGLRIGFDGEPNNITIGYNVNDATPSKLKRAKMIRRLFSQAELSAMQFDAWEV